jgi:hypothetical protein
MDMRIDVSDATTYEIAPGLAAGLCSTKMAERAADARFAVEG